jgi:hypothetical protein
MLKDYIRAYYKSWGSGLTGSASAPFFIYAIIAKGVPRYLSAAFALCAFLAASYLVWKREREAIVQLQGRPEVSLSITRIGTPQMGQHLFGLMNASESTATNVTLSPISEGNFIYRFDPIPSIVRSTANAYMDYHATTLAGTAIGAHNTDMVRVLGTGKALGSVLTYETKLEFSNFGDVSRWQSDYSLRFDFDAGAITCTPGACRKIR